jgi:NTE family protein
VNIIQDRITRSRMAGDPPDIVLSPKLGHIGLLEFYRAAEAIAEGKKCVERMLPEILHVTGSNP